MKIADFLGASCAKEIRIPQFKGGDRCLMMMKK
jgi:hypothetical protein